MARKSETKIDLYRAKSGARKRDMGKDNNMIAREGA